jgi:hypothetical protein
MVPCRPTQINSIFNPTCIVRYDLLTTNTVKIVKHSAVPPRQVIWSFWRKRLPDWTIQKYKAHCCAHGSMQEEGINFWETYAPTVSGHTLWLTLILSLITGLKRKQVKYVSAYTQAPLICEISTNIPHSIVIQNNNLVFITSSTKGNRTEYILHLKNFLWSATSWQ